MHIWTWLTTHRHNRSFSQIVSSTLNLPQAHFQLFICSTLKHKHKKHKRMDVYKACTHTGTSNVLKQHLTLECRACYHKQVVCMCVIYNMWTCVCYHKQVVCMCVCVCVVCITVVGVMVRVVCVCGWYWWSHFCSWWCCSWWWWLWCCISDDAI